MPSALSFFTDVCGFSPFFITLSYRVPVTLARSVTAAPGFHIHRKTDDVSIYIFVDQGKRYRVGRLTILGLNASLESMLRSKIAPGDIFNWSPVLDFYRSQQPVLPPHASPKDDQVYRVPETDKVDVWLDFRACPQPGRSNPGASTGLD